MGPIDVINSAIQNINKVNKPLDTEFDGKNAQKGDKVVVSFSIYGENGESYYQDVKNFKFDILSGVVFEEFEKNFIGISKGEKKEFKVIVPKNHVLMKDVAGKTVKVHAHVTDVQR